MCPPGTDQTTRGPQRWSVMAPAIREQYDLDTPNLTKPDNFNPSKISSFFQLGKDEIIFDAFARLAKHEHCRTNNHLGSRMKLCSPRSEKGSAIEHLPTELLSMLFASAELSTQDIVALGCTSQTLWLHLLGHLALVNSKASWANTPLVCTGTYLTSLPQAVHELQPTIADDERRFFQNVTEGPGHIYPFRGMCPARRWNWGSRGKFTDRSQNSLGDQVTKAVDDVTEKDRICAPDVKAMKASISDVFSPVPATKDDSKWMLRNLTTHEYVTLKHRKINHSEKNYFHVKGLPGLSLDKLIILRASWSGLPIQPDPVQTAFATGMWAGHCFDVVESKQIRSDSSWKDVTADVHEQAKAWSGSGRLARLWAS